MIALKEGIYPTAIITSKKTKPTFLRKGHINGITPTVRQLIDENTGQVSVFEIYWLGSDVKAISQEFLGSLGGKILKREHFNTLTHNEHDLLRLLISVW